MKRFLAAAAGALALAAGTLTAAPAHAAGTVSVTSPSCGTLRVSNTTAGTVTVDFDSRDSVDVPANSSRSLPYLEGGDYYWQWGPAGADVQPTVYRTTVATCAGTPRRHLDGDLNGDGLADVLGIHTDGSLYYFRMGATALNDGVRIGGGWGSTIWMQMVTELEGGGTPDWLYTARTDGTLWRYRSLGTGHFGDATKVGQGFVGYRNFAVTHLNNEVFLGDHVLVASKNDVLYAWGLDPDPVPLGPVTTGWGHTVRTMSMRDFDGDNANELVTIRDDGTLWAYDANPRRVGGGWTQMETVTSPGSLNGDRLSDMVARRSDGNLYKYLNTGGGWMPAQQIGRRWNSVRLLA